ncbi:hypothetical protein OH492_15030 [Vibrio chagasii]|nr:hypothetical protein [Vibrio chagasii]
MQQLNVFEDNAATDFTQPRSSVVVKHYHGTAFDQFQILTQAAQRRDVPWLNGSYQQAFER